MKANESGWFWLVATGGLIIAVHPSRADIKENQFAPMAGRNAFGLKDPPSPVPPEIPLPSRPPAAIIKVTGFTSLNFRKKVLLEITPVGPGKQPTKQILEEGDRIDSVEILAIDVQRNQVTLRNDGVLTNLTFDVVKSTPTPPLLNAPPGAFNLPPVPPPSPQAFNPDSVGVPPGSRGGVTVTGAYLGPAGTGNQPGVDPTQQYLDMRAAQIRARQLNIPHPPVPALPGVPSIPDGGR